MDSTGIRLEPKQKRGQASLKGPLLWNPIKVIDITFNPQFPNPFLC